MLKVRVIPTLLLKDGRLIKTKQFGEFKDVGSPKTITKIYDAQHADELIFLDITATTEHRHFLFDIIKSVAEACFMPITAGGGIRDIEQARELLHSGADKVSINTAAVANPEFISTLSHKFGRSTVIVSIDYKLNPAGEPEVYTHRGTVATGLNPVAWAKEVDARGAGEILLTCIDRDGMMNGYDLPTIRAVADAVTIPVIASGGVGKVEDLVGGITEGHASAVSCASIFHFTDQGLQKAHGYMRSAGLNVRL